MVGGAYFSVCVANGKNRNYFRWPPRSLPVMSSEMVLKITTAASIPSFKKPATPLPNASKEISVCPVCSCVFLAKGFSGAFFAGALSATGSAEFAPGTAVYATLSGVWFDLSVVVCFAMPAPRSVARVNECPPLFIFTRKSYVHIVFLPERNSVPCGEPPAT